MPTAALTVYNCMYMPPENLRKRLDGDTFRCVGNVSPIIPDAEVSGWVPKVRLIRVNAPETGQPGAEEARDALIMWLVQSSFNLICYARDKYGRLLADAEAGRGLLSQHLLDHKLVAPMSLVTARDLVPDADHDLVRAIAYVKEASVSPIKAP